jgi:hypothetical protein
MVAYAMALGATTAAAVRPARTSLRTVLFIPHNIA